MDGSWLPLLSSLLLLLFPIVFAHRFRVLPAAELATSPPPTAGPTTFFEVSRPIPLPKVPPCSTLVLQHDFAFTYTKPPATAPYSPPSCLLGRRRHRRPFRAVLEWSAACRGNQYDRIFGVWLGGVELLRSCTAEPQSNGIVWTVRKDVTRYAALFGHNATLAVFLGNLVNSVYTGVYHANVSFHFYLLSSSRPVSGVPPAFTSPADLILPISRNLPPNDGLWFPVQNSTDIESKALVIPSNVYRAVLELYVSFHADDEFWYTNPPNGYISANNLTGLLAGSGAFREVTVRLDGIVVGAVWPFTVIYTGGIYPLLWRPITGIGSFDLPSYDIELTPFLGKILDGKPHEFGFGVTDALDYWLVDANLHLWLDTKSSRTVGSLIDYDAPEFTPTVVSEFKGLDGVFKTNASRYISSTGWVKSSYGKITTHFFQRFGFKNSMAFEGDGNIQVVNQTIDSTHGTSAESPAAVLYSEQVHQDFPLHLYTGYIFQSNDSYSYLVNVLLGFNEKKISGERFGFAFSDLRNTQTGESNVTVQGNIGSVLATTQQVYRYEGTDGCYLRNISSTNEAIQYDHVEKSCAIYKISPLLATRVYKPEDVGN